MDPGRGLGSLLTSNCILNVFSHRSSPLHISRPKIFTSTLHAAKRRDFMPCTSSVASSCAWVTTTSADPRERRVRRGERGENTLGTQHSAVWQYRSRCTETDGLPQLNRLTTLQFYHDFLRPLVPIDARSFLAISPQFLSHDQFEVKSTPVIHSPTHSKAVSILFSEPPKGRAGLFRLRNPWRHASCIL